ncbi:hypothetical protein VTO42DRAFT_5404 [Malbranchea cinnamomea]
MSGNHIVLRGQNTMKRMIPFCLLALRGCGTKLYLMWTLNWQGKSLAHLDKREQKWTNAFPLELRVGNNMALHHDEYLRLTCDDCGLRERLQVLYTIRIRGLDLMKITPEDVHVAVGMELKTMQGLPGPDRKIPYSTSWSRPSRNSSYLGLVSRFLESSTLGVL